MTEPEPSRALRPRSGGLGDSRGRCRRPWPSRTCHA